MTGPSRYRTMGTASTTPTAPLISRDNLKRKTRREWSFGSLFVALCGLVSSVVMLSVLSCSLICVSVLPVTPGAALLQVVSGRADQEMVSDETPARPLRPSHLCRSLHGMDYRRASPAFPGRATRRSSSCADSDRSQARDKKDRRWSHG